MPLPVELWEAILDATEDTKILQAYALTSSFHCQLARPRLFREITVAGDHASLNFEAFLTFAIANPHLSSCIFSLKLQYDMDPHASPYGWDPDYSPRRLDATLLSEILIVLPKLQKLYLFDLYLTPPKYELISPTTNLNYLLIDCDLACSAPTSCSIRGLFSVLSLFGTVGELVFRGLPSIHCECIPEDPEEEWSERWHTNAYFTEMFKVHPPDLALAADILDTRDLGDPEELRLILQTMRTLPSMRSLSGVSLCCGDSRTIGAHGELVRLCGPDLRSCEVQVFNGFAIFSRKSRVSYIEKTLTTARRGAAFMGVVRIVVLHGARIPEDFFSPSNPKSKSYVPLDSLPQPPFHHIHRWHYPSHSRAHRMVPHTAYGVVPTLVQRSGCWRRLDKATQSPASVYRAPVTRVHNRDRLVLRKDDHERRPQAVHGVDRRHRSDGVVGMGQSPDGRKPRWECEDDFLPVNCDRPHNQ